MLSLQKAASDKTGLGYDFSSSNIASSSTIVFVSPANNINSENNECKTNVASENVDKGKSILGAPPKLEQKETRNLRTKKVNNKKSQPKKPHLCHHCGASGHTYPSCYKWLAIQHSNSTISSRNQNQFISSFASLGNCKVVIYNYVLCWLYSMTKCVVIALTYFLVFCEILLY